MKLSSFFDYYGPDRVSIARYAPRGTPAGFRAYKPVAPGLDSTRSCRPRVLRPLSTIARTATSDVATRDPPTF